MSQARLPRTEPSTELITAHKGNNCDAHAALQTRDFSALPKHRGRSYSIAGVHKLANHGCRYVDGVHTTRFICSVPKEAPGTHQLAAHLVMLCSRDGL